MNTLRRTASQTVSHSHFWALLLSCVLILQVLATLARLKLNCLYPSAVKMWKALRAAFFSASCLNLLQTGRYHKGRRERERRAHPMFLSFLWDLGCTGPDVLVAHWWLQISSLKILLNSVLRIVFGVRFGLMQATPFSWKQKSKKLGFLLKEKGFLDFIKFLFTYHQPSLSNRCIIEFYYNT